MDKYKDYSLKALEKEAKEIESAIQNQNARWFCPNHELEQFLVAFYYENCDFKVLSRPLHRIYYEISLRYREHQDYEDMWKTLEKAHSYNVADLEILMLIARQFYQENDYQSMFYTLKNAYPFIYTRKDMAEYYKLLGCYYLDTYQPKLAQALYQYSNLFFENSQSLMDLKYIEKALQRENKIIPLKELQIFLKKYQIPTEPATETLALLYQVARENMRNNQKEYAYQLLFALYQLTQDKELGEMFLKMNIDKNV